MALTGFNYFYALAGLNQNDLVSYFAFDKNASDLYSITNHAAANSDNPGQLIGVNTGNFWLHNGSGHLGTGYVSCASASDYNTDFWTQLFLYEKSDTNRGILFASNTGWPVMSGYVIGVTEGNRPYFQSQCENGPQICVSSQIYGDKTVLAVTKADNVITFHQLNTDGGTFSSDAHIVKPFLENSSYASLGGTSVTSPAVSNLPFRGYLDEWAFISQSLDVRTLQTLSSGFFYNPSLVTPVVDYTGYIGITGYDYVVSGITGVTGYSTSSTITGTDSFGEPMFSNSIVPLTGYILSGLVQIALTGNILVPITGESYWTISGDANFQFQNFGRSKISLLKPLSTSDNFYGLGYSHSMGDGMNQLANFDEIRGQFNISESLHTGDILLFRNGLLLTPAGYGVTGSAYSSGISLSGAYLLTGSQLIFASSTSTQEAVFYDVYYPSFQKYVYDYPFYSGDIIPFSFSGKPLLFLNGALQYPNLNYSLSGNYGIWRQTSQGEVIKLDLARPVLDVVLSGIPTGNFVSNSSQVFLNGQRQVHQVDYLETTPLSLLKETGLFDFITGRVYNSF